MSKNTAMLTVGQVLELAPGDKQNATWINPGFVGQIESIESFTSNKGDRFFNVGVVDPDNANIAIGTLLSNDPKFKEGDIVEFSGKGLRRTEYKNKAQFSTGRDTDIIVTRSGVSHPATRSAATNGAARPAANGGQSAPPSSSGSPSAAHAPIFGATVGMAMKEALALAVMEHGGIPALDDTTNPDASPSPLKDPAFWGRVHEIASDICRVSLLIEKGKIAPAIKARAPGWEEVPEQAPTPPPQDGPTPEQQAKMAREAEEHEELKRKKEKALAAAKTVTQTANYGADEDVPY